MTSDMIMIWFYLLILDLIYLDWYLKNKAREEMYKKTIIELKQYISEEKPKWIPILKLLDL